MAKTIKKTSPKKSSNFFSKLVPRSSKAKLITFLLVFALIGGGIMAYRSFAASGFGIYTPDQMALSGNTSVVSATGGKSGFKTVQMVTGGRVDIAAANRSVIWAPRVRTCANVYAGPANGRSVYIGLSTIEGSTVISRKYMNVTGNGSYQKVCNLYGYHTNASAKMNAQVKNEDSNSTDVLYVASMSLEYTN